MDKIKVAIGLLCLTLLMVQNSFANETILIVRTNTADFSLVVEALKDELDEELNIIDMIINDDLSETNIYHYIERQQPKLIVVIGNRAIQEYAQYQHKNQSLNKDFPPSLVLSAIYLDSVIPQVNNATGIRNEIPIVTSIMNIRAILKTPVTRVGVIYSEWMQNLIEINQVFCSLERIDLVTVKLPEHASYKQLRQQLRKLLEKDVDALWIPNDKLLLKARLIQNAWMPVLKKTQIPIIVGIDELAVTALELGTFSVTPDFYALGIQGAQMISEIEEKNWMIAEDGLVEPLSIVKLLNLNLSLRKNIRIDIDKLGQIDQIIY